MAGGTVPSYGAVPVARTRATLSGHGAEGGAWLTRHVEGMTAVVGTLLFALVLLLHASQQATPELVGRSRASVSRAEVAVNGTGLIPDDVTLSAKCNYRGWPEPGHVAAAGPGCQCLAVGEHGPGFTGDRCEAARCGSATMEGCAVQRVYPAFKALRDEFPKRCHKRINTACRKMVMRLRDTLNIFGFAYFPVDRLSLPWTDVPRCVPYGRRLRRRYSSSNDPIFVLMQYTQALYQAIGDVGDAADGGDDAALAACEKGQDELLERLLELLKSERIGDGRVTWEEYMSHPGKHDWSISWRSGLYLQSRDGKGQFWGRIKPDPYLSCEQNAGLLVTNQAEQTQKWLRRLENTHRHGRWWDAITVQRGHEFYTIEVFHKVRKLARSIINTHQQLPDISAALALPVAAPVLDWLADNADYQGPNVTYRTAFCLAQPGDCQPVGDLIALLLVDDKTQFPPGKFWHLHEADYAYLRGLVVLGLGDVGTKKDAGLGTRRRPHATGCPDVADRRAYKNSKSGVTAAARSWDGHQFHGTLCGLAGWMGALHDKMVAFSNRPKDGALARYVEDESRVIGRYLRTIDLHGVVLGVSDGTCYAALHPEAPWVTAPVIIISVLIVGAIAAFLLWH